VTTAGVAAPKVRTNKAAMLDSEGNSRFVRAVGVLILSLIFFDLMAVQVRVLLASHSAPELSAYRNIFGLLPSLALLVYRREIRIGRLGLRQWRLALLRGGIVAVAQLCLYTSLGYLELATVAALEQVNGVFVVLLSIVLLRERVGPWRWAAVALGLLGAVLIIRPGADSFSPFALLPVAAALGYATSMVLMRLFDNAASNAVIYLWGASASALASTVLAVSTSGFSPVESWAEAALILSMALCGGTAVLLMMTAYRMTAPASLAPFGYFAILTSFGFGWLFFGEAPVDRLFPGALLIVLAGAIVIWRQTRRPKPGGGPR